MAEDLSILDALERHARAHNPASLGFGKDDPASDYHALWQQVERALGNLRALGLAPGQRVAMSMSNTRASVVSLLAVMRAGATLVPLYHRPGLRAHGKDYERIVSVLRASRAPMLVTHASELATHEQAVRAAGSACRVLSFEAVETEMNAASIEQDARASSDAPAIIQFSAGSTAEPKGLLLTHAQLLQNARGLARGIGWTPQDVVYSWLPLFHDMGLVAVVLTSLWVGSSLRLRTPRQFVLDPLGWLQQMSRERATLSMAPQFAYSLVLGKASVCLPEPGSLDLSSLRVLLNGAEQIDPAACDRFEACFASYGLRPNVVQPGYGLAENCVAVSVRDCGRPRLSRHFDRQALATGRLEASPRASARTVTRAGNGRAVDGTHVVVLDDLGRELAEGEVGELAIIGECTARAALLADGSLQALPRVLRTGDVGALYEGELFVLGRVKEMIKRGGEALSPADIERCVRDHVSALGAVGAFGYLDESTGSEEVVVIAESRQFADLERCRELGELVRAVMLREFRLVLADALIVRPATIPHTTSGKLRRLTLRDVYLRGELSPSVRPALARFTPGA